MLASQYIFMVHLFYLGLWEEPWKKNPYYVDIVTASVL